MTPAYPTRPGRGQVGSNRRPVVRAVRVDSSLPPEHVAGLLRYNRLQPRAGSGRGNWGCRKCKNPWKSKGLSLLFAVSEHERQVDDAEGDPRPWEEAGEVRRDGGP